MDITVNQHVSRLLVTSCMVQNSWMATVHLIMDNALQWKTSIQWITQLVSYGIPSCVWGAGGRGDGPVKRAVLRLILNKRTILFS